MAALQTMQVTLPTDVSLAVVGKAHDTSTIATLSPADKLDFLDDKYDVFNGKARAEVVAKGAKKGSYEQPITPKEGKPLYSAPPASPGSSSGLMKTTSCRSSTRFSPTRRRRWAKHWTTWSTTRSTPHPAKPSPDTPPCPAKPRKSQPETMRSPTSTC